jgi:hypothetical protein
MMAGDFNFTEAQLQEFQQACATTKNELSGMFARELRDQLSQVMGLGMDQLSSQVMGLGMDQLSSQVMGLGKGLDNVGSKLSSSLGQLEDEMGSVRRLLLRNTIEKRFGRAFARQFTTNSLQDVATLLSTAIGWPLGTEPSDVVAASKRLAGSLVDCACGENLLKTVYASCQAASSTDASTSLKAFCVKASGWFPGSGELDVEAVGRSLHDIPAAHEQLKHKLGLLHHLLNLPSRTGAWVLVCRYVLCLRNDCVFTDACLMCLAEQVEFLVTRHGPGVLLGMFQADPSSYLVTGATDIADLQLPELGLRIDVQGSILVGGSIATIQVGAITRGDMLYAQEKAQLAQQARFLQWAMAAALDSVRDFALMGHLFLPKGDDMLASNEEENGISIVLHAL